MDLLILTAAIFLILFAAVINNRRCRRLRLEEIRRQRLEGAALRHYITLDDEKIIINALIYEIDGIIIKGVYNKKSFCRFIHNEKLTRLKNGFIKLDWKFNIND